MLSCLHISIDTAYDRVMLLWFQNNTLILKAVAWQIMVAGVALVVLFGIAGTWMWLTGWIFFVLFFGFVGWLYSWLHVARPDLLRERLIFFHAAQPIWDKIWLVAFYVLSLAWLGLQPLDAVRWRWSQVPLGATALGLVLLLCSLVGIFLVIRENAFLSPLARLQADRHQTVISTGPYAAIRHPLYAAASCFYLAVPLVLGSWLGLLAAPMFIILMMWRAGREERMLQDGLPGYQAYMMQVKYRFIPRVW